ncbi:MAG: alanine--glyoxylate aminotransferase family protein [Xanthomonadaceae bacterium]|nr:alanine--glyoxylate aminotransferase family protein [Xanthomonadaceae bacterium]
MKKTYLLTPGPTPIPESVQAEFAKPIIHHRTPEFEKVFASVRIQLKTLFQTKQEVLTLAATGTGAMDAAFVNVCSPGDTVITLNAGKFGERWTKIAEAYGVKAIEIKVEPGESISPTQVEEAIKKYPNARGVFFQASETSTGVKLPVKAIVDLCKQNNILSIVDAITACGVFELPMDAWNIDVLITGSQKALMIPPGLAFIALSDHAWKIASTAKLPKYYFDLHKELKMQVKNQTAWTPAISLIQGLEHALDIMLEDGLEPNFKRHDILAEATRAGAKALGLELLAKKESDSSTAVTAVRVPGSVKDGKQIPKLMREKYGVIITGGQEELEGKIFRLSHFGYCGAFDITTGLSALEMVLRELGHKVSPGAGVAAAISIIEKRGLFT